MILENFRLDLAFQCNVVLETKKAFLFHLASKNQGLVKYLRATWLLPCHREQPANS